MKSIAKASLKMKHKRLGLFPKKMVAERRVALGTSGVIAYAGSVVTFVATKLTPYAGAVLGAVKGFTVWGAGMGTVGATGMGILGLVAGEFCWQHCFCWCRNCLSGRDGRSDGGRWVNGWSGHHAGGDTASNGQCLGP